MTIDSKWHKQNLNIGLQTPRLDFFLLYLPHYVYVCSCTLKKKKMLRQLLPAVETTVMSQRPSFLAEFKIQEKRKMWKRMSKNKHWFQEKMSGIWNLYSGSCHLSPTLTHSSYRQNVLGHLSNHGDLLFWANYSPFLSSEHGDSLLCDQTISNWPWMDPWSKMGQSAGLPRETGIWADPLKSIFPLHWAHDLTILRLWSSSPHHAIWTKVFRERNISRNAERSWETDTQRVFTASEVFVPGLAALLTLRLMRFSSSLVINSFSLLKPH